MKDMTASQGKIEEVAEKWAEVSPMCFMGDSDLRDISELSLWGTYPLIALLSSLNVEKMDTRNEMLVYFACAQVSALDGAIQRLAEKVRRERMGTDKPSD